MCGVIVALLLLHGFTEQVALVFQVVTVMRREEQRCVGRSGARLCLCDALTGLVLGGGDGVFAFDEEEAWEGIVKHELGQGWAPHHHLHLLCFVAVNVDGELGAIIIQSRWRVDDCPVEMLDAIVLPVAWVSALGCSNRSRYGLQ